MFEPEGLDEDYFTPALSTSLASIFKNASHVDDSHDKTLKYTPVQDPTEIAKDENSKPTRCIFACASHVYQWTNNIFYNRGKLGFALLKVLKTDTHNLVLYNSNKITISYATLTSTFEINVKPNVSLSYYDNSKKYYTIYATENELTNVLKILKGLNVNIKYSSEKDDLRKAPISENLNKSSDYSETDIVEDKTSDTDSSIHIKSKDSIIKKIASMGQSVLPKIESSESSDSDKSFSHKKISRHKQVKSAVIRQTDPDKEFSMEGHDSNKVAKNLNKSYVYNENNACLYGNSNQVVTCKTIVKTPQDEISGSGIGEASMLISEQRVNNTELRININRISDKVDCILETLKGKSEIEKDFNASSSQNIIVQKLLNEYETKIKNYEEYIRLHNLNCKNNKFEEIATIGICNPDSKDLPNSLNSEKDIEILQLKDKIIKITKQYENEIQHQQNFLDEIDSLKKELQLKNEQLEAINKKVEGPFHDNKKVDAAKANIKSIMNDTFQAIAVNFKDDENYSGSRIRSIVATVIKKTTTEAICNM